MECPHFLAGAKRAALYVGWSQARWWDGSGTAPQAPNTKLSITRSFFELQSPDFACKFVWTVQTNTRNTRNTRNIRNIRNARNTKNTRKPKINKNTKNIKNTKNTKKNSPAPAINTQKDRNTRNTRNKTLRRQLLIHKKPEIPEIPE